MGPKKHDFLDLSFVTTIPWENVEFIGIRSQTAGWILAQQCERDAEDVRNTWFQNMISSG